MHEVAKLVPPAARHCTGASACVVIAMMSSRWGAVGSEITVRRVIKKHGCHLQPAVSSRSDQEASGTEQLHSKLNRKRGLFSRSAATQP